MKKKLSECLFRLWRTVVLVLFFACTCIGLQNAFGQSKVTGKVSDISGATLPGVSVVVKGTTNGTITDANGAFSLPAIPANATLVFSFVGMKPQEVAVKGKTSVNATLTEEAVNIDEVVVVGYGTQKRASLIGSVASVSSEEITRVATPNVSQALVGKLPGLITRQSSGQPGNDGVDMYVRGFGSLNSNSPMMLVDGVERSFDNLDPAEIESVTILKDASASAVYGVRGANGVILVTTKRGKSGKPLATYTGSYDLSQSTRMAQYLNGEEFVKWYNYADEVNGRQHTFSDAVVNKVTNGDPDGIYGNTNWLKKMIKPTAPTMHHNLTLNGGSDNIKYFMSLGYLDQEGIIGGSSDNRQCEWRGKVYADPDGITKPLWIGRVCIVKAGYPGTMDHIVVIVKNNDHCHCLVVLHAIGGH